MSTLSPGALLRAPLEFAARVLGNDLNALPEEQALAHPGGTSRPAVAVVAECAAVNGLIATLLTTGEMRRPSPEEREAYYAKFTSREAATSALRAETARLLSAIDALPEARWGEPITGLIGQPSTLLETTGFAALHMMYHDGQINLLQAMHGDSEMHWG